MELIPLRIGLGRRRHGKGKQEMLYTIISLLVLFWLVGLVAHVGGGFIHLLLVVALCVFAFDLISGRRASL